MNLQIKQLSTFIERRSHIKKIEFKLTNEQLIKLTTITKEVEDSDKSISV
ncbi:hypothetical protein KM1_173980, partial [Entamoeba histolytica HM-3:IMSS]